MDLNNVIKDSFLQFGGAVLQSRALPDVRDILKPSARQIFYCMYTDKFTHDKPFQKTLKAIGSCFRLYIHGDASAEGIIMRAGQPFAMRYPLVEVEGSYGTLLSSGSWAAPRYTASRLSPLSEYLFTDIKKEVIEEWRDNYDDTEQYPMVLPSKGFYNIVNGAYGIGVGASSSIPQYNLKELNNALIKLLWNEEISFDEIYCVPDFATGAILLNASEVKESHLKGTGRACKLRSVIEYDKIEKCLVVSQIPYMVYTETICAQLEDIINGEDNPGIERFNDLTGKEPLIKIYLSKNANVNKIIKYLYKNTSLQTHYSINFTVLENGRYPKRMGWREMLISHLVHEKEVYTRGYQFDLRKINNRLHIIDGLLRAIASIDEVIHTIKSSTDTKSASIALQKLLAIDEEQAKAILDIKLARLAHLEVTKLENEKSSLEKEKATIEAILADENLLKKEIEKGLRAVMDKFGDERRTQILDIEGEDDETVEEKNIQLSLTSEGYIYASEVSNLYVQKRNSVGTKLKLNKDEFIINTITCKNIGHILFFTEDGELYTVPASILEYDKKAHLSSLIMNLNKKICSMASVDKNAPKNLLFVTKNGILKKSALTEYNLQKKVGIKSIELESGDSICKVLPLNEENVCVLTSDGQFIRFGTTEIRAQGRVTRGVKGPALNEGAIIVDALIVKPKNNTVISISETGYISRTSLSEFSTTGRTAKGVKIQKLNKDDRMIGFALVGDEKEIIVASTSAKLKISIDEIAQTARGSVGVKSIKLSEKDKIIGIKI